MGSGATKAACSPPPFASGEGSGGAPAATPAAAGAPAGADAAAAADTLPTDGSSLPFFWAARAGAPRQIQPADGGEKPDDDVCLPNRERAPSVPLVGCGTSHPLAKRVKGVQGGHGVVHSKDQKKSILPRTRDPTPTQEAPTQ